MGGGPAGLTCAYFLTLKGYGATIFEACRSSAACCAMASPRYRLPKALLDREIKWITDLGVEVRTGMRWGEDFSLESLKEMGFDAIFLAIGAQKAKTMGIADEEKTEGVIGGVDFLQRHAVGQPAPDTRHRRRGGRRQHGRRRGPDRPRIGRREGASSSTGGP